jgi:hypothetical protein
VGIRERRENKVKFFAENENESGKEKKMTKRKVKKMNTHDADSTHPSSQTSSDTPHTYTA